MAEKEKVDLDFSGITLAPQAPIRPISKNPEKLITKVREEKEKPLGVVISLERGKDRYLFKDLAELTGEEFLEWARRVYPMIEKDTNPRDFDSRANKSRAFEQILRFHQTGLFLSQQENKPINQ